MENLTDVPLGPHFQAFTYAQEVVMNGWNAPPDIIPYLDPHWTSVPAPNPMMHHLLAILYIILMITSLTGNGLVIYIFTTTKELKTSSNILILHLAMLDFLMMAKTPIFIYQSFMEGPVLGMKACYAFALMGSIAGPGNILINAAIAFDRYRCISDPIDGRLTKKQVYFIILFIWAWIFPWVYFPASETWGRFIPEGFLTSCTFDYMNEEYGKYYITGMWFCVWLIPVLIIIASYYLVYEHVKKHEDSLRKQAHKMNVSNLRSGDKVTMRQEVRVAKVGLMLTTLFLFSWTPYAIIAFICAYGRKDLVSPFMSMIPACTCKIAATIDPFVYAINHPRYRIELKKRLPWFCVHEEEPTIETKSIETSRSATE